MTSEELDELLGKWEDACVFAHGGQTIKTPLLVAATLITAGDALADALKECHERKGRTESEIRSGKARSRIPREQ